MALSLLSAAGLALLGLSAGSFLTVVIRRLGTKDPIVWGRSRCPSCRRTLRWFELVPLLSFLAQRGRCRSCGRSISYAYPAVEAAAAGLFIALGYGIGAGIIPPPPFAEPHATAASIGLAGMALWFAYYAFFAASAVAVSAYDMGRQIIPMALLRPLLVVGAGAHLVGAVRGRGFIPVAIAAAGTFLFFWSLWFFSRGRAMGRGDADAALAIVLMLGPAVALAGVLFAFWLGAFFGILLVLGRRRSWESRIPFAPFLFAGAMVALFLAGTLAALNPLAYVF